MAAAQARGTITESVITDHLADLANELRCAICLSIARSPVARLKCCHSFCRSCVQHALQATAKCPLCNAPTSRRDVYSDQKLEQAIELFLKLDAGGLYMTQAGTQAGNPQRIVAQETPSQTPQQDAASPKQCETKAQGTSPNNIAAKQHALDAPSEGSRDALRTVPSARESPEPGRRRNSAGAQLVAAGTDEAAGSKQRIESISARPVRRLRMPRGMALNSAFMAAAQDAASADKEVCTAQPRNSSQVATQPDERAASPILSQAKPDSLGGEVGASSGGLDGQRSPGKGLAAQAGPPQRAADAHQARHDGHSDPASCEASHERQAAGEKQRSSMERHVTRGKRRSAEVPAATEGTAVKRVARAKPAGRESWPSDVATKAGRLPGSQMPRRPKKIVVLSSGLPVKENARLRELVQACGGRLASQHEAAVTHVVCGHDETGNAKRTKKFILGVLNGNWMVHQSWISASLEAGRPAPEEPHEACADTGGKQSGPILGRLNAGHKLLRGWEVHLAGGFGDKRADVEQILAAAGARLMRRLPPAIETLRALEGGDDDAAPLEGGGALGHTVVLVDGRQGGGCTRPARGWDGVCVVTSWLMDSAATFTVQPLVNYLAELS